MSGRSQMMAALRARHAGPVAAAPPRTGRDPSRTDLTTLPGYRQVQMARMGAEALALPNPFFREIEAVRGTEVRIGGSWRRNFASYDYLSLNRSAPVREAVARAVADWGVSSTASRLVGGDYPYHLSLERGLAEFLGQPAALAMVSGHATNQAILRMMVGPGDLVAVDALAHNSVFEGIRVSGASHVSFPHNDWAWLDRHLDTARDRHGRLLIVIEGLYSMDGDTPDLARFVEVKRRHDGWLMIDEAHSIGVLGATGRGLAEAQGIAPGEIDVTMGTLSKAFCAAGGFVAGPLPLIELMHTAPGFLYSVGLPAPSAAAATAALAALRAEPGRVRRLQALGSHLNATARAAGLDCGPAEGHAIVPVLIGDSARAVWASARLLERGFNVLPIIAPAVPDKAARLRIFLNADHLPDHVEALVGAIVAVTDAARALRF
ncbi:aminotransferase class I/II-fold pyridoxal phosphate-dependent enzyme [Frigidibacter sp. MR17.24]|uniref:aminotransferase class I/II-fold pyridoxal phosphate-dependent enzyme n=1 Tax=Frigidibacter sp. MR17.24 TaxID=3127345 RepID=UPI003012CB73